MNIHFFKGKHVKISLKLGSHLLKSAYDFHKITQETALKKTPLRKNKRTIMNRIFGIHYTYFTDYYCLV